MTNRRLLIIDDEVDFAKFVSRVASALGYEVETTTRGEDFKAAVLRVPPDVIILDIVMPQMDGVELIQWLAAQRSAARVIVVTGFNPHYAKMVEVLGIAHGILSITTLVKPIAIIDLQAALMDGERPSPA
jgi:DNA-binding response OmpR family regulator